MKPEKLSRVRFVSNFYIQTTKKNKKKIETKTHAARSHIVLIILSLYFVTLSKQYFTIHYKKRKKAVIKADVNAPKHADTKLNLNIYYLWHYYHETRSASHNHTHTFLFFLRKRSEEDEVTNKVQYRHFFEDVFNNKNHPSIWIEKT